MFDRFHWNVRCSMLDVHFRLLEQQPDSLTHARILGRGGPLPQDGEVWQPGICGPFRHLFGPPQLGKSLPFLGFLAL